MNADNASDVSLGTVFDRSHHLARTKSRTSSEEVKLVDVLALVIWLGCVTVGALGLMVAYPRPRPLVTVSSPVLAQIVEVEIANLPLSPPEAVPSLGAPPQRSPTPMVIPEAAPLPAVVAPSPALAFPMMIEGPTRVVAPAQSAYVRPPTPVAVPAPAPPAQPLTFGQGEGKQPAPDYPRAAVRAGQEGTVRVGFTVGEDGRVLAAEIVTASPWPRLNEAALGTVRQRWRFAPGTIRRYEVPIRFQLQK